MRSTRFGMLLGVLAAGASLALPVAAGAQAPAQDSAVGQVLVVEFIPFPFPQFDATFDAHSGPSGENPTGSVRVGTRAFIADGPVTCLTVTGNRATIGFADTDVQFDGEQSGFLFVEDNGTAPQADRAELRVLGTPAPTVCPVNTTVYDPNRVVFEGDLTVIDAPPRPTTKDQCKGDGWRNFGETFKNQGQCVAFVQRAPKPKP